MRSLNSYDSSVDCDDTVTMKLGAYCSISVVEVALVAVAAAVVVVNNDARVVLADAH